jgi:hypothetical protein
MADGRTGVELALASRQFASEPGATALARIAQGQSVLADVVGIDFSRQILSLRGVFDGAIYHVPAVPSFMAVSSRWMRVLALLVDRGDGFWCQPSVMTGNLFSSNVAPEAFWADLAGCAARLGHPLADPAPKGSALARVAGLAHGVFVRLARPTEQQERENNRKRFAVTSDGDRFEPQMLTLDLRHSDLAALERAAEQDQNLISNGPEWIWLGKGHAHQTGQQNETLAALRELEGGGPWLLTVSSPQRAVQALERLTQILGRTPTTLRSRTSRPWEESDNIAGEESSDTTRVVMSTSFHLGDPGTLVSDVSPLVVNSIRTLLDEPLSSMEGRPRDLVRSPEGQARVEAWLRLAEARGVPSAKAGNQRFLDLDPIRAELGLPTVASTIPPLPAVAVGPLPVMLGGVPAWPPVLLPSRPGIAVGARVGRNDPCPCGSGKKFKKCCGA